jgi:hypothetical protein
MIDWRSDPVKRLYANIRNCCSQFVLPSAMVFVFSLFMVHFEMNSQTKLLIPMDLKQTDHLKSYGIAFWLLEHNSEVDWLLNYRGGSFLCDYSAVLARRLLSTPKFNAMTTTKMLCG